MTALDEIQKASGELFTVLSREQTPSRQEVLKALEKFRETLRVFIAEVGKLHDAAILLTSKFKSAKLAAEVWKDLY